MGNKILEQPRVFNYNIALTEALEEENHQENWETLLMQKQSAVL